MTMSKLATRIKNSTGEMLIDNVKDGNEIQLVRISSSIADDANEDEESDVQDNVERLQSYGITSNPPRGSETLVVNIGGNKDHTVAIVTDSGEYRVQSLASGEVCIYSKFGQKILLSSTGDIVINDGTDSSVGFTALKTGIDLLKKQLNAFVAVYNAHIAIPANDPSKIGALATASIDLAEVPEVKLP